MRTAKEKLLINVTMDKEFVTGDQVEGLIGKIRVFMKKENLTGKITLDLDKHLI